MLERGSSGKLIRPHSKAGSIEKQTEKQTAVATSGLIFKEAFLWEKSSEGRCAMSLPEQDVEQSLLDPKLTGDAPELPQLSELDVVRHYTRLSQWNFGVDSGMYPLGSCTMKYNPKTNEVQAAHQGFTGAHPLSDEDISQGALELMYNLEQYLQILDILHNAQKYTQDSGTGCCSQYRQAGASVAPLSILEYPFVSIKYQLLADCSL